ncbi:putative short-chain dehydrogenase/reductase family 42E member 2 [Liparis tanakae]|uniref:Putative short-chain dehydrogenase/reductase family 42E member 2 n=1 Tax=Liparis tanakae TaxID=230148 RepID=A0A4Z2J529_9TELE|nr:putative short-chain dehydrogenase/reductase family 42E member 2 [Liparis tanakae]
MENLNLAPTALRAGRRGAQEMEERLQARQSHGPQTRLTVAWSLFFDVSVFVHLGGCARERAPLAPGRRSALSSYGAHSVATTHSRAARCLQTSREESPEVKLQVIEGRRIRRLHERKGKVSRVSRHRKSMELCGPNMSERGGSLCQVKHLACHSVAHSRLQASGPHIRKLSHQPWVNHPASSPTLTVRHTVRGAMATGFGNPECAVSRVGEEAARARGASTGKVVVTGGGGYFGFRLARELASQGMSVVLLDMNKLPSDIPDGAIFYQSDIRDYSSLYKVCEGVDCIFHTASYGMSGPEQLRKEQVESVNVGGTNNIINVCKERSIPRLVYTSSINVVVAGNPIEDGDEASVPCVPPDVHIDHYSRTKAIAEQMVLSANGCSLKGGGLLRTCILRPCGIYGPEERRHLHRVMVNVERRLFSFRFGDPQARMNWVHVDNLVLAHTLAAEALALQKSCVAVRIIAVSHTFKIDKARRELGYSPKPYSLLDSVEQYLKSRKPRPRSALFSVSWTSQLPRHLLVMLLLGLSLLLLMLFCMVKISLKRALYSGCWLAGTAVGSDGAAEDRRRRARLLAKVCAAL